MKWGPLSPSCFSSPLSTFYWRRRGQTDNSISSPPTPSLLLPYLSFAPPPLLEIHFLSHNTFYFFLFLSCIDPYRGSSRNPFPSYHLSSFRSSNWESLGFPYDALERDIQGDSGSLFLIKYSLLIFFSFYLSLHRASVLFSFSFFIFFFFFFLFFFCIVPLTVLSLFFVSFLSIYLFIFDV